MILKTGKRELNMAIIRPFRDLYSRLRIHLKVPPDKGMPPIPRRQLIPVKKEACQGAMTSPGLIKTMRWKHKIRAHCQ